jgi:hypothetical protein
LLDAFFLNGRDPTQRQLVLYVNIDNASAHNARVTQNFFEHQSVEEAHIHRTRPIFLDRTLIFSGKE